MIAAVGRASANIIVWLILLLLVVLTALTGSGGSVFSVLLALLLLPILINGQARLAISRQPAMWIFLVAFVAIMVCYAITAVNPGNLLYGTALLALPLAPLLYAARRHWQTEQPGLVLLGLCLIGTMVCSLVALNSFFLLNASRAVGFLMGPNVLARLAVLLGFVALAGIFLTRSWVAQLFYLGPVLAALVVALTGTRGALLAMPVAFVVTAIAMWIDQGGRRDLWKLALCAVISGIVVFSLSNRMGGVGEILSDVVGEGTTVDGATSERMTMLAGAWGTFLHSPWVGFGWANFKPAAALAMDMTPYGTDPGGAFQFHNDFANFSVAAGIVGVLALVAILAAPVVGALAAPHDRFYCARLYCCLQLSVSYAVFGLTDFTMGYDLPTTLYAFLTAMILATFRDDVRPSAGGPAARP